MNPSSMLHAAIGKVSWKVFDVLVFESEINSLTMQCKVERLDGGEWIASEYKFSKADKNPDFPFERLHGGRE
jgi:hypothetical protein